MTYILYKKEVCLDCESGIVLRGDNAGRTCSFCKGGFVFTEVDLLEALKTVKFTVPFDAFYSDEKSISKSVNLIPENARFDGE